MRESKGRRVALCLLTAGACAGLVEPAAALADATAGRAKVRALCQNCHGEDGVALLPAAPNLGGQQKAYLVTQLRAYRSGSRQDPQMSIVAKTLSDADIESVADWYSGIKVTLELPK